MANSHTDFGEISSPTEEIGGWHPPKPPKRGARYVSKLRAFYAYILSPGFTMAFHSIVLNRSPTSIAAYRAKALRAAKAEPEILEMVTAYVRLIGPQQALEMAQARGAAQMPYWSRLAVCEWHRQGLSRAEIAKAFRCAPGTVDNILHAKGKFFEGFSGNRRLTYAQLAPPGRWTSPEGANPRRSPN